MEPGWCIVFYYAFNIACISIPFAFVTFSIQRLCSLLYYTKNFFKTKRWIALCISIQWLIEFLISLPFVFRKTQCCKNEPWMTIYTLMVAVVLPSLVNFILNSLIFHRVQSSTFRVHPQACNAWTSGMLIQQEQQPHPPPKMSRREISMLRQMVFMFIMLIGGWSPVLINNIIDQMRGASGIGVIITMLFAEICVAAIIANLFRQHHELNTFLLNKIKFCFRR